MAMNTIPNKIIENELENDINDIFNNNNIDYKDVDLLAQKIHEKRWRNQEIDNNDAIEMLKGYIYEYYQGKSETQIKNLVEKLIFQGYHKRYYSKNMRIIRLLELG